MDADKSLNAAVAPTTGVSAPLISIVIANYNYERYVGAAIASALAIDWPAIEVIVVDDGSADGSRPIIESYAAQGVKAYFLPNSGQAKAAEYGYRQSHGDIVMFLDSDDAAAPSIARETVPLMSAGWSKIQVQMNVINESGGDTGQIFPKFPRKISPQLIRQWSSTGGYCPTPPNSGNLYSREFLEKIFPLEDGMDDWVDSYCLSVAPLLGDVYTVAKPLVSYRVHGKNDGAQAVLDPARISRDLRRHFTRCEYSARLAARHGVIVKPQRWRFDFYNLAMRIASLRMAPANHPLPKDSVSSCVEDAMRSFFRPQGMTAALRIATFSWLLLVAIAPLAVARALVSWRFVPDSRPGLLRRVINAA